MNKYKCLKQQTYSYNNYTIIPLREADIFLIKAWRNAQMNVLRQASIISDVQQQAYYDNVISKLFTQDQPPQLLFSLLYQDKLIGYGGIVHIQWHDQRGEISFLLDPAYVSSEQKYEAAFLNYLELIKELAFDNLHLNKLFTETYDIRDHHISCLEKSGFILEGVLKEHIYIDSKPVDSLMHGYLKKYYNEK